MTPSMPERDESVAALLDEALADIRAGRTVEEAAWKARYPDLADDLLALLGTLRSVASAVEDWRLVPASTGARPELSATSPPARNLVPGMPVPEQIGRYRILAKRGEGGMGTVYRAWDDQLQREVAVKVPRFERAQPDRATAAKRFLREARAAAGVRHPYVCPIHDVGEDQGTPYAVMAFIDGSSLAEVLEKGALEPAKAADLARKVALGLEAIHAGKIVHRDLKPANILLDQAGEPLLTDFGLARPLADTEHLTQQGIMVGTPAYMAPEQAAGLAKQIGPRTDVYSLGVVLYQMLTSRLPFLEPPLALLDKIARGRFPSPRSLRPDLDPALEAIVLKAMARQPTGRYPSAHELALALEMWLSTAAKKTAASGPSTVDHIRPLSEGSRSRPVSNAPATLEPLPRRRWAPRLAVVAAAFLLIATLLGVVLWVGTSQGQIELTFPEGLPADAIVLVDGAKVTWTGIDNHKAKVTVRAGGHGVTVRAGAREYQSGENVEVPRSGKVPLTVTFRPAEVAAASGDNLTTTHGSPAAETPILGEGPASPVSMTGQPGHCSSLVFTADGLHALSESGGGGVYVWDLQKRLLEKSWTHMLGASYDDISGVVAVSPDGRLIAAAGVNSFPRDMLLLSLYDQKTYTRVGKDFPFSRMSHAIAFSPDSSKLAVVELPGLLGLPEPCVHIIEVQTGNGKQFPSGSPVNSLAFSPDGKFLVTGGNEKRILLWSLEANRQEREFVGHAGAVDQVAFSNDGKRIFSASSADCTLRVWNNDKDAGTEEKQIPIGKVAGKMVCATFWPGGRALTGHLDGTVVLWDLAAGEELKRFSFKAAGEVTAVAVSPDGRHGLAALTVDRVVFLFGLPPSRAEP